MSTRQNLTAVAAIFSLVFCACAGPGSRLKLGETREGEVVEAEGLSAVTDDLIGTKRAALSDAYKNAVEKVVGVYISARTRVDKAVTIEQNILGKTDGYVKKHEMLREGKEPDGLYHAHIRALVSYEQVKHDLEALNVVDVNLIGNPRVAVLLDETLQGQEGQTTGCSDALAQALLERGYKVVDRSELAAIRVAEATKQLVSGDASSALKPIMQKLKAEVVVTGKASASPLTGQNLGGLISYRGTILGKALRAQTGEILATVNIQASGLDATSEAAGGKAMTALGKAAGDELAGRIASELSRKSMVLVTLRKLPGLDRLSEAKTLLAKTAGVSDIYMRSYEDGVAEMEVKVNSATSADLAKALSSAGKFTAIVTAQTQDSLEADVQ